jgi:hypothetical protein
MRRSRLELLYCVVILSHITDFHKIKDRLVQIYKINAKIATATIIISHKNAIEVGRI